LRVDARERPMERLGVGRLRHDAAAGEAPDRLERRRVPGVRARDVHLAVQRREREHLAADREARRHAKRPARADLHLVGVGGTAAHGDPPPAPGDASARFLSIAIRSPSTPVLRATAYAVVSLIWLPTASRARSCSIVCMPPAWPDSIAE